VPARAGIPKTSSAPPTSSPHLNVESLQNWPNYPPIHFSRVCLTMVLRRFILLVTMVDGPLAAERLCAWEPARSMRRTASKERSKGSLYVSGTAS
jgi:hypothetical protein